jgi:hypothetical protein
MSEPRSRLQLLHELQRLSTEHATTIIAAQAKATPTSAALWDRYSFGELTVIADFLTADIERLAEAGV